MAGEVVAVNESLAEAPEQLNADPYGEGWICEIAPTNPTPSPVCSTPRPTQELIAS